MSEMKKRSWLDRTFELSEHKTNVRTEILAGLTTFLTMAYILAVNPNILSAAGMDRTAVLVATCLGSCIATAIMAFAANLPFALSAGMGLNAFMAYTVVLGMGMSWQTALFAVFVEGIIFIILTFLKVREAIFSAIPMSLKIAVSVGIGLFICFIGLQNAGIVVANESTLVSMIDFTADFRHTGICALLALVGVLITAVLYICRVRGSILIGIVATWALGIASQAIGLYAPDPEAGFYSVYPSFGITDFTKVSETFGQCFTIDLLKVGILTFVSVVFAFLFVDIFDGIGTLIGGAEQGGLLDKDGNLRNVNQALMADAVGTTAGAICGTSTITTFVESVAGIAAGGRTGLTALTVAVLFAISSFFAPIFTSVPSFATAPALIVVGFLMFRAASKLKLSDESKFMEAIPSYICIIAMPLLYSIAEGIALGVISYVVINIACRIVQHFRPLTFRAIPKVSAMMYGLAVLFVLKYIFL